MSSHASRLSWYQPWNPISRRLSRINAARLRFHRKQKVIGGISLFKKKNSEAAWREKRRHFFFFFFFSAGNLIQWQSARQIFGLQLVRWIIIFFFDHQYHSLQRFKKQPVDRRTEVMEIRRGVVPCRKRRKNNSNKPASLKTWLTICQQIYQDWGKIFLERKTIITWWIWNIWLVSTAKTQCLEKKIPKSWTASYLGARTSVGARVKAAASVRVCPDSCCTGCRSVAEPGHMWLSPVTWRRNSHSELGVEQPDTECRRSEQSDHFL